MRHDDSREMLGLHALDALEPEDARRVQSHVRICSSCRAELTGLRETAAELARAVTPVRPSDPVSRWILEGARPAQARRLAPAKPAVRRWLPWAMRLAAAGAFVVLVASQVSLLGRLDHAMYLLARGRELLDFMTSPDVTIVQLQGTDSAPGARALLAYSRALGRVTLFGFDLPPAASGKTYQLWLISERIHPAGILSHDARGGAVFDARWPSEQEDPSLFAITIEPREGAEEPAGPILLLSDVRRSRRRND